MIFFEEFGIDWFRIGSDLPARGQVIVYCPSNSLSANLDDSLEKTTTHMKVKDD